MKYTTLIFDLGNVVLTNDWHYNCPEKFQEYSDYFGITYENMEKGWNQYWPNFLKGKITEEEFWKGFLETAEAKTIDIEHAKKLYRKYQKENENMLGLLNKLKEKFRLVALTTISKEWLDWKRQRFNLDDYFEEYISSGYTGLTKRDPRIYELLIEKIGGNLKEYILIDDEEDNLSLAKEKGIMTIRFTNQRKLGPQLRKFGILK